MPLNPNIIQFKDAQTDASIYPVGLMEAVFDSSSANSMYHFLEEYNVSAHHRNSVGNRNGKDLFIFSEAIALVPADYRHNGLTVTFKTDNNGNGTYHHTESWVFKGTSTTGTVWSNASNWVEFDRNYVDLADSSIRSDLSQLGQKQGEVSPSTIIDGDYTSTAGTTVKNIVFASALLNETPISLEFSGITPTKVAFYNSSYRLTHPDVENPQSGQSFFVKAGTDRIKLFFDALPASTHYHVSVIANNLRALAGGALDKVDERIGKLSSLSTLDKENVVGALNEVNAFCKSLDLFQKARIQDAPEGVEMQNNHVNISSGESSRALTWEFGSLAEDTYAFIVVSSDCTITFATSGWVIKASYTIQANKPTQIIIPAECPKGQVILPQAASASTRVDIFVKKGTLTNIVEKLVNNDARVDNILVEIPLFEHSGTIASGSYRQTIPNAPYLEEYIPVFVEVKGMDVKLEFSDTAYSNIISLNVNDGQIAYFLYPPKRPRILVNTQDGEPVSSNTNYSIRIVYIRTQDGFNEYQKRIEDRKYIPILLNMNRTKLYNSTNNPSLLYKTLVLQSITDSHDNLLGVKEFIEFNNRYGVYINDMIGLGDYYSGGLNITPFRSPTITGWANIIKAIGNHDAYDAWPQITVAPESDVYDAVLARNPNDPDISHWGVTYQQGKTYFYKDYEDANVRVVFLDYMHWDDANDADGQIAWLRDVLGITNGVAITKHVVIVIHARPSSVNSGPFVPFSESTWADKDFPDGRQYGITISLPDIVKDFQDFGGVFVAYLCGHEHIGLVGKLQNYKQLIFLQQTAAPAAIRPNAYEFDTNWEKQFCLISVDTEMRYLRIFKVGAEFDRNMQHMGSLLLKYGDTAEFLSNS